MQNESSDAATRLRPRYLLGSNLIEQHLSGADTGDSLSLFENWAPPSSRTPIHIHACDDETLYVLKGEVTAIVNQRRRCLRAGESIFLQRLLPHQLMNEAEEAAHYLLLCTPSGFEGFLEAAGSHLPRGSEPAPPSQADIQRMLNAAPKFGITILQSWPNELIPVPRCDHQ